MKKRVSLVTGCIAMILLLCVSGCSQALSDLFSDVIPSIETAIDSANEPRNGSDAEPKVEPGSEPGIDPGSEGNVEVGIEPTDVSLPEPQGLARGTLTLSAVSPGNLKAATEAALIAEAGQAADNFDFTVISKLILTDGSELNIVDQDFIMNQLTALATLDLSGHITDFSVGFQDSKTLTAVKLPVEANLADSMFNGCSNLLVVMFPGNNAPEIGADDFADVDAVAYVPDPSAGGFEYETFHEHFSKVLTIDQPAFTAGPSSQTADEGQSVTFTVETTGAPAPSLQWQESFDSGASWGDLSGQTGSSLHFASVSLDQSENQYRCLASSLAGSAGSDIAVLAVSAASATQTPEITSQPTGGTVYVDDVITLSVAAQVADGGTLSYQWYSNNTDSNTTGTLISGATRNTYTPPTAGTGTTFYYVAVTNTNNSQTAVAASATARVTVNARTNAQTPNITAQPGSTAVSLNSSITLSVTATVTDGGALSYQWFRNTANSNTGGTQISGATGASYAPPTDAAGEVFYYVTVTNTNNNVNGSTTAAVTSSTAKVTVNALVNAKAPEIIDQPVGGEATVNSHITLSVTANSTDEGVLSYQWFENEVKHNTGGVRIAGAIGATYAPPTGEIGEIFYYVEITNINNAATGEKTATVISEVVSITVYTTPGAPRDLIAIPSEDEVLVSWMPPQDDGGSEITGYEVSDDYGRSWSETTRDNRYLFTGLTKGSEYTFRVRAVNAAGHGEEASITVTVTENMASVTGVALDRNSLDILAGERVTLTATVSPEDAGDKSVTWESSDETVATVNSRGVVSAHTAGKATITVTTNDRGFRASCDVTVKDGGRSGGGVFLWIMLGSLVAAGATAGGYVWWRKRNMRGNKGRKK